MTISIGILVLDGMTMIDASGPAEVFNLADPARYHYDLVFISPAGGRVASSSGMELGQTLAAAEAGEVDTLLIAGGALLPEGRINEELLSSVASLASGAQRVASGRIGSHRCAPEHSSWRSWDTSMDAARRPIGGTRTPWQPGIRASRSNPTSSMSATGAT